MSRFSCSAGRPPDAVAAGGVERDRDIYAALDLGTNNCRLLVARASRHGFTVVDAFSRIVRLGENLGATGRLSHAAMSRTLAALRVCAEKMRGHGVTRLRTVATEACRRAVNCAHFLEQVRAETGIELEVIDQEEEARLALYGCAPLLDPGVPNALIFDIGGGSTELSWLEVAPPGAGDVSPWRCPPRPVAYHSVPIGVVELAERYGSDDITPETYQAMVEEAAAALRPFAERSAGGDAVAGRVQMIGTSGTATTLAGVHRNLARYDRRQVDGCDLEFDAVRAISRRIVAMSYHERVSHPCIGNQRADLVIAGCAILEAICRIWPVGRLRVADRGLREGMLFELMRGAHISDDGARAGAAAPVGQEEGIP